MTHRAPQLALVLAAAVLGVGLAAGPLFAEGAAPGGGANAAGPRWARHAEKSLCLGRGVGQQLMTQEEWQTHRQGMRQMAPDERARYRAEWHAKMRERAKEKGIELPEEPCPPAGGRGPGMGHGAGRGRGMEPGGGPEPGGGTSK